MFKVSPRRISAALCLICLSFFPLVSLAQEMGQQNPQQIDTSPMLDLTQQPTVAPSATLPTSPSVVPTTRPSTAATTRPSVAPTTRPSTVPTTIPSAVPVTKPSAVLANPTPQNSPSQRLNSPESPEPGESTDSAETPTSSGGADIPPDPNVLDNAIHTPIYTKPIGKAPAPLDAPSEMPENQRSPYSILSIVLWTCFIIAAAATGYFLYVRFSDKD